MYDYPKSARHQTCLRGRDKSKKLPCQLFSLLGLALLGFPSCTPAYHDKDEMDWVVVNHTADTLVVTVRYPLDSNVVSPDQVDAVRQQQRADSAAHHGRGYFRQPLRRLSQYDGRWYRVDGGGGWINPFLDNAATVQADRFDELGAWTSNPDLVNTHALQERAARIDRLSGILTYHLPPQGMQLLTSVPCPNNFRQLLVSGLWLEQGATRRTVLARPPLTETYSLDPGSENGPHVQLVVGRNPLLELFRSARAVPGYHCLP